MLTQKQTRKIAEVRRQLHHGPGSGWRPVLAGRALGPFDKTLDEREASLRLWLTTWIIPELEELIEEYNRAHKAKF